MNCKICNKNTHHSTDQHICSICKKNGHGAYNCPNNTRPLHCRYCYSINHTTDNHPCPRCPHLGHDVYNCPCEKQIRDTYAILIRDDRREPDHEGYCSDAGSDTGESEHDIERVIRLDLHGLNDWFDRPAEAAIRKCASKGYLTLKELSELRAELSGPLPCRRGSGYCYYTGYRTVHDIHVINPTTGEKYPDVDQ